MIRPIDLQNTILQSMQSAPAIQRAEEGPRLAAQAVQAAFAAELTQRDESVAATVEVTGNRIGAKPDEAHQRGAAGRQHRPQTAFEDVVEEAAGSADEPAHLIDYSA